MASLGPIAKIEVVLERDADEVSDRVLGFFSSGPSQAKQ